MSIKRNALIIALVFVIALQGMEKYKKQTLTVHGTCVEIVQGPIFALNGQVDVMALGKFSQQRLSFKGPFCGDEIAVGSLFLGNDEVYSMHADDKGLLSKNCIYYNAASSFTQQNYLWFKSLRHTMNNKVIHIAEPRVREIMYCDEKTGKIILGPWYYEFKSDREDDDVYWLTDQKGEKAIEKALEDLAFCYFKVLNVGLLHYKSIAIDELSTDVGIARDQAATVVAQTIGNFIKYNAQNENVKKWEKIVLCVKGDAEFKLMIDIIDCT